MTRNPPTEQATHVTESPRDSIGPLLETAPPPVSTAEAERIGYEIFGLRTTAQPLAGERDSNFLLSGDPLGPFILKVSHPAEDPLVADLQTEALLHVAAHDSALPVPRVRRTTKGATTWLLTVSDEPPRPVRVLSYLQGVPLHQAPTSPGQRRNLGTMLARLDQAMRGFAHPAAHHELLWDIKHAAQLRGFLDYLPDPNQRALARRFLDGFECHVAPVLRDLRTQVIHNDINPHNVLVDSADPERIAGIIDFGDMVHSPLINNLAVACAYHPTEEGHPLDAMADVVNGYHRILPLKETEIALLFDLIATRLVISVTISGWRAARHPQNRDYILRNSRTVWAGLQRFGDLSRSEAQDFFLRLCRKE